MIQLTPQMRILVAIEPADFRKGIDGLARVCRKELEQNPFSGAVFLFHNRRRTAIKILVYDGQGFWLCQKRLSAGRFRYWPGRAEHAGGPGGGEEAGILRLKAVEAQLLLSGGDPSVAVTATPEWRKIHAE